MKRSDLILVLIPWLMAISIPALGQRLDTFVIRDTVNVQIPVVLDHPGKATVTVYSTIANLQLVSNIGVIEDLSDPGTGRYRVVIEPRRQAITIRAQGFRDETIAIVPPADGVEHYAYSVSAATPSFVLDVSANTADAAVYVDGQFVGTTPYQGRVLAGAHELSVRKSGYRTFLETIALRQDMRRVVELSPGVFQVNLSSVPTGANVLINGSARGVTDTVLELDRGVYDVELQRDGFHPWRATLPIYREEAIAATLVPVSDPLMATLRVTADPPEAVVTVDGEVRGRAPMTYPLAVGTHTVLVTAQGYAPWEESIELGPGEARAMDVLLEQEPVSVSIESSPPGARVVVDGIPTGTTPFTGQLIPGIHQVRLELMGYRVEEQPIDVASNRANVFRLSLSSGFQVISSAESRPYTQNALVQFDGRQVVVLYDLSPDKKRYQVALQMARPTGEVLTGGRIEGDLGKKVPAGTDRRIVWQIPNGLPAGIIELRLDVSPKSGPSKVLLGGGGVLVAGGVACLLFCGDDPTIASAPPGRPLDN